MKNLLFTFILAILSLNVAQADSGDPRVLELLKNNPIVNAAVDEAMKYTQAETCNYEVVDGESTGANIDYSAEITCSDGETAGLVRVKGRIFSFDGPHELTLSIFFAG